MIRIDGHRTLADEDLQRTHGRSAEWARSLVRLETIVAIAARVRRTTIWNVAPAAIAAARTVVDSGTDTIAKFARLR